MASLSGDQGGGKRWAVCGRHWKVGSANQAADLGGRAEEGRRVHPPSYFPGGENVVVIYIQKMLTAPGPRRDRRVFLPRGETVQSNKGSLSFLSQDPHSKSESLRREL